MLDSSRPLKLNSCGRTISPRYSWLIPTVYTPYGIFRTKQLSLGDVAVGLGHLRRLPLGAVQHDFLSKLDGSLVDFISAREPALAL